MFFTDVTVGCAWQAFVALGSETISLELMRSIPGCGFTWPLLNPFGSLNFSNISEYQALCSLHMDSKA